MRTRQGSCALHLGQLSSLCFGHSPPHPCHTRTELLVFLFCQCAPEISPVFSVEVHVLLPLFTKLLPELVYFQVWYLLSGAFSSHPPCIQLVPQSSICTSSVPGASVPCCTYFHLQLLSPHFCFLDQTKLPRCRNSVVLFPCPQYPGQYLGPSGIEVQEMRLQRHEDGF